MIDANEIKKLVHELARLDEYQLPSGATNEDCDAFSQRTGITMSPELKEWLLLYNGPCIGPGGLYGIHPLEEAYDIEDFLAPSNLAPEPVDSHCGTMAWRPVRVPIAR